MNLRPLAVILAAGVGKRFWPITDSKYWVNYLGSPYINYLLEEIKKTGIVDVVIVTTENIKSSISAINTPGLHIKIAIQNKPSGMADALISAKDLIIDRPILILNASDYVESILYKEIAKLIPNGKAFTVGKRVNKYIDAGYLKINDGLVEEIIEKPGEQNIPSDYVKLVYDFIPESNELINLLSKTISEKDDVYEKSLNEYIKLNGLELLEYNGTWKPSKYPWHILDLMEIFLQKLDKPFIGQNVTIKNNVIIEGNVYIGNNVKINEFTKIVGPCFINDDTIIGNNVIIRDSQIGKNCVIGYGTDIARSYIGDNNWFHSNYVGDSVIGENVSFGAGTVTANVRLDETNIKTNLKGSLMLLGRKKLGAIIGSNVRIGSNSTLMPGIKIGSNVMIGAGTLIGIDIPDNKFVVIKENLLISDNSKMVNNNRSDFKLKIK